MKGRLGKYLSILLTASMLIMLMPSMVLADDETSTDLTQIGSVLDFEDDELVGTVDAPEGSGPASITVTDYDNNKVLRIHPPDDNEQRRTSSIWWTLPLDRGEYDLSDYDQIEVSFDWWVDITRPWQNSLDVRLNNGADQVITLRSSTGNNVNSPTAISYYAANAAGNNMPEIGSAIEVLTGVPRLTKLSTTINIDLRLQVATFSVTDGAAISYTTSEPIAIAEDSLTSMSIGASRASGSNWARFNPVNDVVWDEDTYGMRVDNITFKAASSGLEKPIMPSGEVMVSPTSAELEYGGGSLADKHSATFSAIVLPINATDRTFTWMVDDDSIVDLTVNEDQSATVTAIGEGMTTLKAVSNMDATIIGSVPIDVTYVPAIAEPTPDFTDLLAEGYTLEFGSNFASDSDVPLWIFEGGTYHSLARENSPQTNNYFRFDASGSGNRGGQGYLPWGIIGNKVYAHFDWKVPEVSTGQNTFNLSFQHSDHVLLSLRTGTYNNIRTIGAFAGSLPGPTGAPKDDEIVFWETDRYHAFTYNDVNIWYTVGVEFDFEDMMATISLVPRDDDGAGPSVLKIPFEGNRISSFVLTGERAATQNINVEDNGIDNLYFFTTPLSDDTIIEVLPYEFLPERPATADENTWQSWTKTVYIGEVTEEADLNLPETIEVKMAGGHTATVDVTWELTEVPWAKADKETDLVYDPHKQGVFSYVGTMTSIPDVAVVRMGLKAKLYIENRHKQKITDGPFSMEWLDRGVVAVPVNSGEGVLVTWRLLASEYDQELAFNVYRNSVKINTSPITALNYIDVDGQPGDSYVIETVNTDALSKPATAWANNYIDIPLQRPADRPNPAVKYGATDAAPITYTPNDMSVADVNGDGQYEILVKWYPSEAQDPGLANRHTGETILDLYTLEGELLWRINLGINIVSSAHHSPFNFYDLDQDGIAELAIKTADGTRIYHPKEDGTIDDLTDEPVWVLGDPQAVWVGGLENPAQDNELNNTALGRVASGPETFTVFNGATGEPMHTVDYFAPYDISPNWGDNNNNRSDRFNAAVAYMPKNGVNGAEPYPTLIEVRGHYGPHYVGAYQFIDGEIKEIWTFTLAEWHAGSNQGNHNLKVADVDFDGYQEVVLGAITLDHDGSIVWSATGTRGTLATGHGDALHVAPMLPDSEEIYVFQPHEDGPPNNVTLVRGSTGEPVWTYSANLGDVGRGVAANITPLPGYEVWALETPMYNIVSGEVLTTDVGGIGVANKAPVNFILYWDGDLLSEFFDGPNNPNSTAPPAITKFDYNVETGESELVTLQELIGSYSNNGTKATPGLIADIFGDWREEVLVRTNDNDALRIYTTDLPTDHAIYTLMHDPQYRMAVNLQNSVYNQPAHLGFYLGEDIRDDVEAMQLPVSSLYYTIDGGGQVGDSENSKLSAETATFYTNAKADIAVTVTLNGNLLKGILHGDTVLSHSDYTLAAASDGKQVVTIKSSYLSTLLNGDVLTFVFSAGDPAELEIRVTRRQSSGPDPVIPSDPDEETDEDADTDADSDSDGETPGAEKPILKDTIANAEQLRRNIQQALQSNSPIDFPDVPESHWAVKAINYASQLGIIEGTPSGEFKASDHVTRAQFATMIVRALGIDTSGEGGAFSDTAGHWADATISALHRAGVVNGTGSGTFKPDQAIKRAEMAAILARVLSMSAANGSSSISDISGHWAADHIEQLSEAGIVFGVSADRFAPEDTATRDQSIVIIMRMLNMVLDLNLDL